MVDDFLFIYSLTKAGIFAIILVLLRGDNIMGYTLDKDGIKDIKYCDYVEITDVNDDEYIYNVFYSDEYGLCLCAEDEPLIKFLHIRNSRLESYYVTGEVRVGQKDIKTIVVDDHWLFKKNKSFTIYGTLLQYNYEMGMKYNLHPEEYYDKFPKNHASGIKIKNKIYGGIGHEKTNDIIDLVADFAFIPFRLGLCCGTYCAAAFHGCPHIPLGLYSD